MPAKRDIEESRSAREVKRWATVVAGGDADEFMVHLSSKEPLESARLTLQVYRKLEDERDVRATANLSRALLAAAKKSSTTLRKAASRRRVAPIGDPRADPQEVRRALSNWQQARTSREQLDVWFRLEPAVRRRFEAKLSAEESERLAILCLFHPSEVDGDTTFRSLASRAEGRMPKAHGAPLTRKEENAKTLGQGYLLATPNAYRPYFGAQWRRKPGRRK